MILRWFKVINLDDFLAMDLVSHNVELELEGIGIRNVLVTQGVNTSILYDDIFLSINLNDANPFVFDNVAVYLDADNDIWLGVLIED